MNLWSGLEQEVKGHEVTVFLILGAQQAVAVERILTEPTEGKVVCLNFSSVEPVLPEGATNICIGRGGFLRTLRQYRQCFAGLSALRNSASVFFVALPHVYHSVANFLAFSLTPDAVDLLPDGMLNYYDAQLSPEQYRKTLFKRLASFLLGGRYHRYRGNFTAMSVIRYRRQYAFSERNLFTRAQELILLKMPVDSLKDSGAVLFLDQPLEDFSYKQMDRLRKALVNYFKDVERVLYKPHPRQLSKNLNLSGGRQDLLSGAEAAEYVVQKRGASEIVGICSSALVTLRIMYPDLPCTSIGFNLLCDERPELTSVRSTMEDFEIVMVDA